MNNIAGKKISNAVSEVNVNRYSLNSGYTFPVTDKERNFPLFHNGKHRCWFWIWSEMFFNFLIKFSLNIISQTHKFCFWVNGSYSFFQFSLHFLAFTIENISLVSHITLRKIIFSRQMFWGLQRGKKMTKMSIKVFGFQNGTTQLLGYYHVAF